MRAVQYQAAGPAADVLQVVALPEQHPAPGEVRVALEYSAVNPTDVKRRLVESPGITEFLVPHHDGAGVIDEVGEGIPQSRIGERVWVFHGAHDRAHGTAAESICLPAEQAVALPPNVSLIEGALIGIPMMTAAHTIRLADVREDHTIVITGGGGAVGSAAIALASLRGANVIATVSSADKAEIARTSGAHHVVDYRHEDVATVLTALDVQVNAVIDVAIGRHLPAYSAHLADGARIVSYSSDATEALVPVRPLMFANAHIAFFVIYSLPEQDILTARDDVTAALLAGVRPSLPRHVFDMQECAAAHEHVEARSLGRAVIRLTSGT